MKIYISNSRKERELFLYNSDDKEITEAFFDLFNEADTMRLSEEEKKAFNTDAYYTVDSDDVYNAWCEILNEQQRLLDKAAEHNLTKQYNDLISLNIIKGVNSNE